MGKSAAPAGAELEPAARNLFEALRQWRAQVAREQGVPAYVIFHDSTLRAIANAAPGDSDELGRIPGMGAAKQARYGAAVLALGARVGDT